MKVWLLLLTLHSVDGAGHIEMKEFISEADCQSVASAYVSQVKQAYPRKTDMSWSCTKITKVN